MADTKISGLTALTTPLDADVMPIVDTANTATKKVSWANIKATLKTYFDSLTTTLSNKTLASPVLSGSVTGTYTLGGTPSFGADVSFGANTAYFTETDNGNSGTADTIDWGTSNKQKSTLTGNVTYTFTAPAGPCNLVLKILTGAGSFTATWPASVKWSGGTAPTITTTASRADIVTFYYDGTNYYGSFVQNFTP